MPVKLDFLFLVNTVHIVSSLLIVFFHENPFAFSHWFYILMSVILKFGYWFHIDKCNRSIQQLMIYKKKIFLSFPFWFYFGFTVSFSMTGVIWRKASFAINSSPWRVCALRCGILWGSVLVCSSMAGRPLSISQSCTWQPHPFWVYGHTSVCVCLCICVDRCLHKMLIFQ